MRGAGRRREARAIHAHATAAPGEPSGTGRPRITAISASSSRSNANGFVRIGWRVSGVRVRDRVHDLRAGAARILLLDAVLRMLRLAERAGWGRLLSEDVAVLRCELLRVLLPAHNAVLREPADG